MNNGKGLPRIAVVSNKLLELLVPRKRWEKKTKVRSMGDNDTEMIMLHYRLSISGAESYLTVLRT